jgi:hypothetical protein
MLLGIRKVNPFDILSIIPSSVYSGEDIASKTMSCNSLVASLVFQLSLRNIYV